MSDVIEKYTELLVVLLTTAEVIGAAGVVDRLSRADFTPFGWVFLATLVVAIVLHAYLYRSTQLIGRRGQKDILSHVLDMAPQALVYPGNWSELEIRAYCHRYDSAHELLHYVASRSSNEFDDKFTDIPLRGVDENGVPVFVIAEAVIHGETVHRVFPGPTTEAERTAHVWAEVGQVLACPIYKAGKTRTIENCLA